MKALRFAGWLPGPRLAALAASAQVPATLTPADKVYGLSKFWQEVNYNFVCGGRASQAR